MLSLEALALRGDGHPGIVHVDQSTAALHFLVELRFADVRGDGRAIFSELGGKISIDLGSGCVPVYMNGNIMNAQFTFRESLAHQALVDILLYLLEAVLVAQRMDKRHVRRIQPDLSGESGVRSINGFRLFRNEGLDCADLGPVVDRMWAPARRARPLPP